MKRQKLTFLTLTLMLGSLPAWALETQTPAPTPIPGTQPATVDSGAAMTQPAREVAKLATAGVPDDVIKAYIDAVPNTFNLSPENIIHLQGIGVSAAVTSTMLAHDKAYVQNAIAQQSLPPQPQVVPQTAPLTPAPYNVEEPQSSVSVYTIPNRDYYDILSPYGSWGYYAGVGWTWAPYSWCSWNAYPWGCNFFGAGRWWCHPTRGWCWSPSVGFRGGFRTGFGGGFRAQASFGGSRVNSVGHVSSGFHGFSGGGVSHSGGFSSGGHNGFHR